MKKQNPKLKEYRALFKEEMEAVEAKKNVLGFVRTLLEWEAKAKASTPLEGTIPTHVLRKAG